LFSEAVQIYSTAFLFSAMKQISLAFLLLLSTIAMAEEKRMYDIFVFGNNIGRVTLTHEKRPDGTDYYLLTSQAKMRIFWTDRAQKSSCESVFKDGRLISSNHIYQEKTGPPKTCVINTDGKVYHKVKDGLSSTFTEAPTYTIVNLYYQEPKNIHRIFYEADGAFEPLKNTEPNTYEFKSQDGTRNVYHYKNGEIEEMEFHLTFVSVKMKRVY